MHRKSYYPHNQQITTQLTSTSSSGFGASRPQTPIENEDELFRGQLDGSVNDSQGFSNHHLNSAEFQNGYGHDDFNRAPDFVSVNEIQILEKDLHS